MYATSLVRQYDAAIEAAQCRRIHPLNRTWLTEFRETLTDKCCHCTCR
jgi:hypothetical protein